MPALVPPAAEAPLDRFTADCRQRRVPLTGLQDALVVVVTEVGVERSGRGDGHLVVGIVCPLPGKVAGQRAVGSAVSQERAQVSAQLCWQGREDCMESAQHSRLRRTGWRGRRLRWSRTPGLP
jgi:hypothetical protein